MDAYLPETQQRRRKSQRLFGARVRDAPVERGSEVVMVKLQAVELRPTLVAEQAAFRCFGERGQSGGVAVADEIRLSALIEAVARELADCLQHDQPRFVEIRHPP